MKKVILVDNKKPILKSSLSILREVMPNANVKCFTKADEAVAYAKANHVALAFLGIELRSASGFDLCRDLLNIDPHTNVVYLTAYAEYSYEAWKIGACGFLLKPLTRQSAGDQLKRLRYPILTEEKA